MTVNLSEILTKYNQATALDLQTELKPIIKSYKVNDLAEITGISVHSLYRYCLANPIKPSFSNYLTLLAIGHNRAEVWTERGMAPRLKKSYRQSVCQE